MDVEVSRLAAAIGEPARARMLFCLMDGRARTATELAIVAEVSASTASTHLGRLQAAALVRVQAAGKHRYFTLAGRRVARMLESLAVLAGATAPKSASGPRPRTPLRLRAARSCYDHLAGTLGVAVYDRLQARGWLDRACVLTARGETALAALGLDVDAARARRRRFAFACLDWSERRPHLGGALGAALLDLFLAKKWLARDLDSRALALTSTGRRRLSDALALF